MVLLASSRHSLTSRTMAMKLNIMYAVGVAFLLVIRGCNASKGNFLTKHACEGQSMNISCANGQLIRIVRANYGRFSLLICNEQGVDWANTQCQYEQTLPRMRERCERRVSCIVEATSSEFGDNCPNITKHLEVQYECIIADKFPPDPNAMTTPGTFTTEEIASTTITPIASTTRRAFSPMSTYWHGFESSTTTMVTSAPEFCPVVLERDVLWPQTIVGTWCKTACPNNPGQYAQWYCGIDGVWGPASADLSRCVSAWAQDLRNDITRATSVELLAPVAQALEQQTRYGVLYGGDTTAVGDLMNTLVNETERKLAHIALPERKDITVRMSTFVVNTVNNMLEERNKPSWKDLPISGQRATGARLMQSVDHSAQLLADALGDRAPTQTLARPNLILEVSVVPVEATMQFPSQSLYDHRVDSVQIPSEALSQGGDADGSARVMFASYKQLGEYMQPEPRTVDTKRGKVDVQRVVASNIVSASVNAKREVRNLKSPVLLKMLINSNENYSRPMCVFWNMSQMTWSDDGCSVLQHNATHTLCACDHMTHFAVLMDLHGGELDLVHELALVFLTNVGCVVSVVCLVIVFIALQFFRIMGGDRRTINKNLCVCLVFAELTFLFGIGQTEHRIACGVVAGLLHYFFLAAFAWMLLEGFQLYALLYEVFEPEESRRLYFYSFGYGLPLVIVGISLGVDYTSYGTTRHCWLNTDNYFVFSFVGPVVVVLMANIVFLVMAVVVMCRNPSVNKFGSKRTGLEHIGMWVKAALVLVFLLGLTWAIGVMYINESTVFMAYAFTVLNSLQGLFIFIFHVVLNDKLRREYRKWLRRNDWLPNWVRGDPIEYQRPHGAHRVCVGSQGSHSGTPQTPLHSNSTSSDSRSQSYLAKLFQLSKLRKRSSAQFLLARSSSCNSRQGTVGKFEFTVNMYGPDYVQYPQHAWVQATDPAATLARHPPPSFPPPPPPPPPYTSDTPGELDFSMFDCAIIESQCGDSVYGQRRGGVVPEHVARQTLLQLPSCSSPKPEYNDSAYSEGGSSLSANDPLIMPQLHRPPVYRNSYSPSQATPPVMQANGLEGDPHICCKSMPDLKCRHVSHFDQRSPWRHGRGDSLPQKSLPQLLHQEAAAQMAAEATPLCASECTLVAYADGRRNYTATLPLKVGRRHAPSRMGSSHR